MGIRMVRQPSETPNVTNIDDIIPFRYAYGDQDGYVIGKGNEISHTIDGSTFRVNSGRVVLQGVETDIDANGVSFTIDNASETRYFVVYYEVNLATQTTAIKLSTYSTSGYPTIDRGDDLTTNSSGIARMPLYRFTANVGLISNVEKIVTPIEYVSNIIDEEFENIKNNFSNDQKTQFGSYIFSKKKLIWSGRAVIGLQQNVEFSNSILGKKLYIETSTVNNEIVGGYVFNPRQFSSFGNINIKYNPILASNNLGEMGYIEFGMTNNNSTILKISGKYYKATDTTTSNSLQEYAVTSVYEIVE